MPINFRHKLPNFTPFLILLSISVFIFLVNLNFSKDYSNYKNIFVKQTPIQLDSCEEPGAPKCISRETFIRGGNALASGDILSSGESIYSTKNLYRFVMGTDGILVVYNKNQDPFWFVPTMQAKAYFKFEHDGNLVIYSENNQMLWESKTANSGANHLVMHSNGNLVLYADEKSIWDSNSDKTKIKSFKEIGFFSLVNLAARFTSFNYFLFLIILASLSLKFYALRKLKDNFSWFNILPYLMVLIFLHEGTQIRIAISLSIFLWALIFYLKDKLILAAILLLVAASFHVTILIFTLVVFADILNQKLGNRATMVLGAGLLLIALIPNIIPNLIFLAGSFSPKISVYFNSELLVNQNKSGLFQYFVIFIGALVGYVFLMKQYFSVEWIRLYKFSIISGVLAILILWVLRNNVIIASRLAEVLMLPVLLAIGEIFSQLYIHKKRVLLVMSILPLFVYMLLRSYVVFN
jgi:hypothetical protein